MKRNRFYKTVLTLPCGCTMKANTASPHDETQNATANHVEVLEFADEYLAEHGCGHCPPPMLANTTFSIEEIDEAAWLSF
jgi:hypothetical protein